MPWKDSCQTILTSAKDFRLYGLLRDLWHEPRILKEYDAVIKEQLEKGIFEINLVLIMKIKPLNCMTSLSSG